MPSDDRTQIGIRFPNDVLALLRDMAEEDGRTLNEEVVWIVRDYLSKQEDGAVLMSPFRRRSYERDALAAAKRIFDKPTGVLVREAVVSIIVAETGSPRSIADWAVGQVVTALGFVSTEKDGETVYQPKG